MFMVDAINTVIKSTWEKYDNGQKGHLTKDEARSFVADALGFKGDFKDRDNAFEEVFKTLDLDKNGCI